MKPHTIALLLCLSGFSSPDVLAEESMPLDIVKGLISYGENVSIVLGTKHSGFPDLTLPKELEYYASIDRGRGHVSRIYLGNGNKLNKSTLYNKLNQQGWDRISFGLDSYGGFVSQTVPTGFPDYLCHKDLGTMDVKYTSLDNGVLVTLAYSGKQSSGVCDRYPGANLALVAGSGGALATFADANPKKLQLPVLELPDGVESEHGYNSSSGNGEIEHSSQVSTSLNMSALINHFMPQMETQGWSMDASMQGRKIAVSGWLKNAGKSQQLAQLHIVESGNNGYKLRLSVQYLENESAGAVLMSNYQSVISADN